MGMFDSFYTADGVEWQTKAYGCALDTWRIGDTVPSQPASAYQVEIFGGHRSEKVRWSTATVRDDHLVSIDDPREPALPLVGYGGGVTEMPTLTETRTEWRVLTHWGAVGGGWETGEIGERPADPKLRYDLIPEPALAAMAHAFTVGTKHGDGIKVESFATEYAAIMRHLEAWRRGETIDPDDGLLHLGAVMARCAKLIATGTKWEGE